VAFEIWGWRDKQTCNTLITLLRTRTGGEVIVMQ